MTTLKRIGVGLTAAATAFTALFTPMQELFPVAAAAAQEVQADTDAGKKLEPSQPDGKGTPESPFQIGSAEQLLWFAGYVNGTLTQSQVKNDQLGTDATTSDAPTEEPAATSAPETTAETTTEETTAATTEETSESTTVASAEAVAVLEDVTTADTTSAETPAPSESASDTADTTAATTPAPADPKIEQHTGACAVLTADIDLKGSKENLWYPIGRTGSGLSGPSDYKGVFDGKGYTISNLYIDSTINENGRAYTYGLFGNNAGTIRNVEVNGEINLLAMDVGLISASNTGTIENCLAKGKINGSYGIGGITGYNTGLVRNCYTDVTCISSSVEYGAVVGVSGNKNSESSDKYGIYNCFYNKDNLSKNGIGQGHTAVYSVDGVTNEQLATGEIAWKLQNGDTVDARAEKDIIWGQKLGKEGADPAPVLLTSAESANKVIKVTYMLVDEPVGYDYQNKDAQLSKPNITYAKDGYTAGDKWYKEETKQTEWNFTSDKVENDIVLYSESVLKDYKITLELDGGTLTAAQDWELSDGNYTKKYTIKSDKITLPSAAKEGYEFLGWISEQNDSYSGEANLNVSIDTGSIGDRKFKAVYRDNSAPKIKITLDTHNWETLYPEAKFDLFFKDEKTVYVTAEDNIDKDGLTIAYYLSSKALTEAEVKKINESKWIPYTESGITLSPINQTNVIVYVRVTDKSKNHAYASSTGLVFDITNPVISGISNNGVYCTQATFSVKEENVKTVTINNTVVYNCEELSADPEPDDDLAIVAAVASVVEPEHFEVSKLLDKYTITNETSVAKTYTITVEDRVGNKATDSVTINGQHSKRYNVSEEIKAPTCTEKGVKLVHSVCRVCGIYYGTVYADVDARGHSWNAWENIETPNCNNGGLRSHKCRVCGLVQQENLVANGHDWEETPTIDQPATCKNEGSQSIHCKNCDAILRSEKIPQLQHQPGEPTEIDSKPATCTSDGFKTIVTYCNLCGEQLDLKNESVASPGHTWGEWTELSSGAFQRQCSVCGSYEKKDGTDADHKWATEYKIEKEATCTTDGSKSICCTICGTVKESVIIPAKGHTAQTAIKENEVLATCTDGGSYDEVTYCTDCHIELLRVSYETNPNGHTWGDWVDLNMPDCDDSGTQQHTCEVCGATETRGLDASGHTWADKATVDVAPSCTTEGSQSVHCLNCEATKDSKVIPALGHTWGAWETLNAPDCDDTGTQQRKCTVCGVTETNGLEASGHKWESFYTVDVPPTCTTDGSQSYHCEVCDICGAAEVIPALGHDWGEWETLDMPDCDDSGTQQRTCKVCGVTETKGLEASGHKWETTYTVDVEPTCTTEGSQSYHCEVCDVRGASVVIPALGHDWGEWETLDMPDCDDSGTQQRTCKVCGITETKGLEASGHKWKNTYTVDVQPTCTTEGSQSYHCEICDVRGASVVIPALGHKWSEWETLDMPDCDDSGTQQRTCEVCGVTETKGLDPSGHKWQKDFTVDTAPTCASEGSKSIHCENCSATKDSTIIPPTDDHTWGEWKTVLEATCVKEGVKEHECKVCKKIETAAIPVNDNHQYGEWYTVTDATCGEEGIVERKCELCGKIETAYIPATEEHTPKEAVRENVKPADCGHSGSYESVVYCSVCGVELSRTTATIPATGEHKYTATVVAPTYGAQGYTLHTCSVCGDSYKDTYTAKRTLDAVKGFGLKARAADAIRVKWTNNTEADGYELELLVDGKWKNVSKAAKTATEYRYSGLSGSTKYEMRIRAYKTEDGKTYYSAYTTTHYTTNPTVVKSFKLTARTAKTLTFSWTKDTSADGYIIEKKVGSEWKRVTKLVGNTKLGYIVSGLSAGTVYSIRIKPYHMAGSTALYGKTVTLDARTAPSDVTGLKLKGRAADALRLAWTKNTSADGYIIEKKVGNVWKRVTKITKNTTLEYRISGLSAATEYMFRVRSYKMSGKTALYSGYVYGTYKTNPSAVSGLKLKASAKDAVRLSWTKNTSADGYIIEMKVGGVWKRAGKITKNSTIEFKKSGLKSNTSYSFRVKTYKMSGKTALYGATKTITVKTK